eukprot:TRINITY_DN2614_c0_g1_i1.p2 TRINITY_DN2614_c0_g1~~TRINITY_DN2614_c0_g1_i1.p2  ORF type:complete len:135 (-),score=38.40 TRINITY_DN2614_c0_g1_i1:321-725(-)
MNGRTTQRRTMTGIMLLAMISIFALASTIEARRINHKSVPATKANEIRPDNAEIYAERESIKAQGRPAYHDEEEMRDVDAEAMQQANMYQMFQRKLNENPKYAEIVRRVKAGELSSEDPIVQAMIAEVYAKMGM